MESTIFCPFCGKKIASSNTFCPFCGKGVAQADAPVENITTYEDLTQRYAGSTFVKREKTSLGQIIPIGEGALFAGMINLAVNSLQQNVGWYILLMIVAGFAASVICAKVKLKWLRLGLSIVELITLVGASLQIIGLFFMSYNVLTALRAVVNFCSIAAIGFAFGLVLATRGKEGQKLVAGENYLLTIAGSFLVIRLIEALKGLAGIYLPVAEVLLLVVAIITIVMIGKSPISPITESINFAKSWNIVGLSTGLWLVMGYLFAVAPDFFTTSNIEYQYDFTYEDPEVYWYRAALWLAFGIGLVLASVVLFALKKNTKKLALGYFAIVMGLVIQIIGFVCVWYFFLSDFGWLHIGIVGLGFGISLAGVAFLLYHILTSLPEFNPLALVIGPILGLMIFMLTSAFAYGYLTVIIISALLAVLGVVIGVLSLSKWDALKQTTK